MDRIFISNFLSIFIVIFRIDIVSNMRTKKSIAIVMFNLFSIFEYYSVNT